MYFIVTLFKYLDWTSTSLKIYCYIVNIKITQIKCYQAVIDREQLPAVCVQKIIFICFFNKVL